MDHYFFVQSQKALGYLQKHFAEYFFYYFEYRIKM